MYKSGSDWLDCLVTSLQVVKELGKGPRDRLVILLFPEVRPRRGKSHPSHLASMC